MSSAQGLSSGGGALGIYGDIMQGQMTSASLNAQADGLMNQAAEAESAGRYDAMRQQIAAGKKIGSAEASYGASGVASTSGSVAAVIESSHQNAEMDRLNILHGADVRAINYENQASMDRYGGQSAAYGGFMKSIGTAVSTAADVAAM